MKDENIQYTAGLFVKICQDVVIKCVGAWLLVVSNFFVDDVLTKALAALFFLIIFDSITGVLAAKRTGDKIRSAKLVRTPIKIAIYFMLITAARIAEYSIPDQIAYLDEVVLAFLTLTELVSVMENIGKMGYAIPKKLLANLISLRDEK